jgi:site-specific recombinase XerD
MGCTDGDIVAALWPERCQALVSVSGYLIGSQESGKMTRFDGANLLKRRLRDAGIVGDYSPHSFRAAGMTNYLENGGTLEVAQRIAGHADSRTT